MARTPFPLSQGYRLLEPGPVVLLTTARKGRPNVMTLSWHTIMDECYASLECKLVVAKLAAKYCFFILEVLKAWVDRSIKHPQTMHHLGRGTFMVAGQTIKLPSKMK